MGDSLFRGVTVRHLGRYGDVQQLQLAHLYFSNPSQLVIEFDKRKNDQYRAGHSTVVPANPVKEGCCLVEFMHRWRLHQGGALSDFVFPDFTLSKDVDSLSA